MFSHSRIAYFPEFFFPPAAGELSDFDSELQRLRGVDEQLVRLEFAIPLFGSQVGEGIARDPAALEAPATRRPFANLMRCKRSPDILQAEFG